MFGIEIEIPMWLIGAIFVGVLVIVGLIVMLLNNRA